MTTVMIIIVTTVTPATTTVDDHRYYHRDANSKLGVSQADILQVYRLNEPVSPALSSPAQNNLGSRIRLTLRHTIAPALHDYTICMSSLLVPPPLFLSPTADHTYSSFVRVRKHVTSTRYVVGKLFVARGALKEQGGS